MAYKLFLQFEYLPDSLNVKLVKNFRERHRENKSWDLMVKIEIDGREPRRPLPKANISIIRHSWRMLDYDGLVGSMKPVVDALVTARVLKDDSWEVTGRWNVSQKFRSKSEGPLLELIVQELPDKLN